MTSISPVPLFDGKRGNYPIWRPKIMYFGASIGCRDALLPDFDRSMPTSPTGLVTPAGETLEATTAEERVKMNDKAMQALAASFQTPFLMQTLEKSQNTIWQLGLACKVIAALDRHYEYVDSTTTHSARDRSIAIATFTMREHDNPEDICESLRRLQSTYSVADESGSITNAITDDELVETLIDIAPKLYKTSLVANSDATFDELAKLMKNIYKAEHKRPSPHLDHDDESGELLLSNITSSSSPCQLCDKHGHSAKECPMLPTKSVDVCLLCKKAGHDILDCPTFLALHDAKLAASSKPSQKPSTPYPVRAPTYDKPRSPCAYCLSDTHHVSRCWIKEGNEHHIPENITEQHLQKLRDARAFRLGIGIFHQQGNSMPGHGEVILASLSAPTHVCSCCSHPGTHAAQCSSTSITSPVSPFVLSPSTSSNPFAAVMSAPLPPPVFPVSAASEFLVEAEQGAIFEGSAVTSAGSVASAPVIPILAASNLHAEADQGSNFVHSADSSANSVAYAAPVVGAGQGGVDLPFKLEDELEICGLSETDDVVPDDVVGDGGLYETDDDVVPDDVVGDGGLYETDDVVPDDVVGVGGLSAPDDVVDVVEFAFPFKLEDELEVGGLSEPDDIVDVAEVAFAAVSSVRQPHDNVVDSSLCWSLLADPNIFIADSGSTQHSTGYRDGVIDLVEDTSGIPFVQPSGTLLKPFGYGRLCVTACHRSGRAYQDFTISEIAYVPEQKFNIISTTQLHKKGFYPGGDAHSIWYENGKKRIVFDLKFSTPRGGYIFAGYLRRSIPGASDVRPLATAPSVEDQGAVGSRSAVLIATNYDSVVPGRYEAGQGDKSVRFADSTLVPGASKGVGYRSAGLLAKNNDSVVPDGKLGLALVDIDPRFVYHDHYMSSFAFPSPVSVARLSSPVGRPVDQGQGVSGCFSESQEMLEI